MIPVGFNGSQELIVLLLAVHISDHLLTPAWWLSGYLLMGLLALVGARRVRDEEIPRIALLTAAFFIASLIHVRVGPTSVHLLLNGLVGVLLGWRAALAIPMAVFLQYVMFAHGGYTTIGINSCVMTIPALLAGYLFALLRRMPALRRPWFRASLVGCSCLLFIGSAIFSVTLLTIHLSDPASSNGAAIEAGLAVAASIALHPAVILLALIIAALAAWAERKLENAPEFPLGLLVGELAVLATVALNCLVLLAGGESDWRVPALLLVVAHVPVAVIEGIVLGFSVGLLARVRPDILGLPGHPEKKVRQQLPISSAGIRKQNGSLQAAICRQRSMVVLAALLCSASPAWAHRLHGEYKILPGNRVRIESWFDLTEMSPAGASVRAYGEGGALVADGKLDNNGIFVFSLGKIEPIRVLISAGAGHRKELRIPRQELEMHATALEGIGKPKQFLSRPTPPMESLRADRRLDVFKLALKALLGIGIVAGLTIFALAWRKSRTD